MGLVIGGEILGYQYGDKKAGWNSLKSGGGPGPFLTKTGWRGN